MPQTFAITLCLSKNLAIIPQPFATILSTNEVKNIVNACYTAASVNIQQVLQAVVLLWSEMWRSRIAT